MAVLGSVDILAEADEGGGEVDEGQVVTGELVEAGEDPAEILELTDKAFDEVAFLVELGIILTRLLTVVARWDHCLRLNGCDKGQEPFSIERLVC